MTDHTSFFDLIGRDLAAMLGIAEYLELLGRDRVASMVRSVTFSIESTIGDLRHDLSNKTRRGKSGERRGRAFARARPSSRRRVKKKRTRNPS